MPVALAVGPASTTPIQPTLVFKETVVGLVSTLVLAVMVLAVEVLAQLVPMESLALVALAALVWLPVLRDHQLHAQVAEADLGPLAADRMVPVAQVVGDLVDHPEPLAPLTLVAAAGADGIARQAQAAPASSSSE